MNNQTRELELAEMLGISFVAYVSQIEEINNGNMLVQRMVEDRHKLLRRSYQP